MCTEPLEASLIQIKSMGRIARRPPRCSQNRTIHLPVEIGRVRRVLPHQLKLPPRLAASKIED
jgi:hypothetical protein